MKMSISNVSFSINPIAINAKNSDGAKPEDMDVNINSEGATFSIEKMEFEISIAEISECFGSTRKATTTAPVVTTTAAAPEAPASNKADEALDICRAILHKIDDLKKSSTPAPKAPKKSKAPKATKVAETNDEDEYI